MIDRQIARIVSKQRGREEARKRKGRQRKSKSDGIEINVEKLVGGGRHG